jgi:uncharacterized protein (DUF1800 family)
MLSPMPRSEVAHLLRRTGFGPRADEVEAAERAGYDATADALIAGVTAPQAVTPWELAPLPERPKGASMPEQRRAYAREIRQQSAALALWWLDQMVATSQPFVERLTLFWHGHWATSIRKVRVPALMLTQNETLRTHAAGDFRTMAHAMVQDPALLVWLDAGRNKRESPNENLSRELMELFTLGRGFYSEEDVREGARALTGWRIDRANGDVRFVPRQHDPGPHTILGATASYDSESLVDHLVAQPQSARFVVERLWARFGKPEMPDLLRDDLIAAYESQRNVAATMSVLLRSPEFLAASGVLVKSPIEWAVGAMRVLGIRPSALKLKEQTQALFALSAMGQVPFAPPSVDGWPSGSAWLGTAATQARLRLAAFLAARADVTNIEQAGSSDRVEAVGRLLVVDAWTPRTQAALASVSGNPHELLTVALSSPEYTVA